MSKLITKTFTGNGSTEIVIASKFTILAGSDNGTDFGSGTLTAEVSHGDVNYTTAHSFTEEGAQTSIDYVGGVSVKLTLAGSTNPSLTVTFKYEG